MSTAILQQLPSLSVGLFLGLSLVAWNRQQAPSEAFDVVQARELRLVDSSGNVRWIAGVSEGGEAYLELSNGHGDPVVFLGASGGDGALELRNAASQRIVFAGANADGDGGLRTENRDGGRAFYVGDDVRGNARVPKSAKPGGRIIPPAGR